MNNDAKIIQLLGIVEQKRQQLGTKPRHILETNGVFKFPTGNHFNINATADPNIFIEALSFLLERRNCHAEACKLLEIENPPPFVYNGYDVEQWGTDFKNRIAAIRYNERKLELARLEKKLNGLVSEEGRTASELDEIAKLLG